MANNGGGSSVGGIDVGKLVAGGFTLVAGVTAIAGSATGAAGRFLRNDPGAIVWSVILSLIAIGLALIASQLDDFIGDEPGTPAAAGTPGTPAKPGRPKVLLKFALILVSFIVFAWAGVQTVLSLTDSLASSDRPRIAGSWNLIDGQPVLSLTVQISGMKITDNLNVSVRPVRSSGTATGPLGPAVFTSQTGADAAGDGDLSVAVPLPPGYQELQVVANLGIASVTCDGHSQLTPASPTPTPIPSGKTPAPVSSAPNNAQKPVFSCITIAAPAAAPTPTPSPSPQGND
jgi:hypothetical protein